MAPATGETAPARHRSGGWLRTLVTLVAVLALPLLDPATGRCGSPLPLSSATAAPAAPRANQGPPRIVFLGDSLTSGFELPPAQAYPALVQERLRRAGLPHRVVNAGVSGDTTAGALSRLEEALEGNVRLVVLAIGCNDGMRGLDLAVTRRQIEQLVQALLARGVKVLLAAMEIPPNYGPTYVRQFREIYTGLAARHRVPLMPFMLDGVAGDPEMNLPDGIHPNARGHARIAENVWKTLEPLVR
ncbi:MAG: arylesterase [Candidatus Riflebacteria bacterium]|nr:arylesterase [Candidatus Riflebacteria bacterium]